MDETFFIYTFIQKDILWLRIVSILIFIISAAPSITDCCTCFLNVYQIVDARLSYSFSSIILYLTQAVKWATRLSKLSWLWNRPWHNILSLQRRNDSLTKELLELLQEERGVRGVSRSVIVSCFCRWYLYIDHIGSCCWVTMSLSIL